MICSAIRTYNLGTQEHWKKKAQIAALTKATARMIDLAEKSGVRAIGLPRIGAGLGGLDWRRVKEVLNAAGARTEIDLVVFVDYIPAESSD